MKKLLILTIIILSGAGCAFADIFSHPAKVETIQIPQFQNVSCKFSQTRTIPQSNVEIESGGEFQYIKDKGVIFETKFPVQMTTNYTTDENKRMSSIIAAINNKDYSYLNKNFNMFYEKNAQIWTVALKPKADSKISPHISSIVIQGQTYINKLDINTVKNGSTKINFTECR
ncbi:hypothetical protein IAC76_01480 [Spirochaetes bacterium]|uniref:Lipoprotein n=1 Tax=Candidatus Scatousia excrementipullorum TaxID=2840936 RepID=A0A9D9DP92_9BACT|nr:hypothetical protein [Candidatus Scatousia excrementipullorum]